MRIAKSIFLTLTTAVLTLTACGRKVQQSPNTADCASLKFEQRAEATAGEGAKKRAYSIFVENFDRNAPCWEQLNQAAKEKPYEPGGKTTVLFFDCPHHTLSSIDAENPTVEGEYKDFLVARYVSDENGKTEFVKFPFANAAQP
ncbi:MAG: hypothetical protein RMM53_02255 [Bacteroidia bacterium]|nr:hypothetical protein [Bacteroidia bacterium]MDW8333018.1 hypothetical protein [Bacteroidia bacterium]